MGYTHYWQLQQSTILPTAAVLLLGKLLWRAYNQGVIQYGINDPRPPLVSDMELRFNGVGAQGHETFHFQATADTAAGGGRRFQFCQTTRKPYDEVVMQVLLVLRHYLGEAITVTSDGDFAVEWAAARHELARRYGIHTPAAANPARCWRPEDTRQSFLLPASLSRSARMREKDRNR